MASIILQGELSELFPPSYTFEVRSPIEGIRAIAYQVDGFIEHLLDSENRGVAYKIAIDGEEIDEEMLDFTIDATMVITPVLVGSGVLGRIIGGALLVGAALLMPAGVLGLSSSFLGLYGASMVVGGIIEMLTPTPEQDNSKESFLADASGQSGKSNQGSPIPILIGNRWIKPPIISFWVDNNNVAIDFVPN